jgi:hypothetical protein
MYVDHDPEYHYFAFSKADRQRLRPTVLFDLLVNNADRKGSHILKAPDDRMWLIDHGVCFHAEDKLRTVIWDFVGEPIPEHLCADIHASISGCDSDNQPSDAMHQLSSCGAGQSWRLAAPGRVRSWHRACSCPRSISSTSPTANLSRLTGGGEILDEIRLAFLGFGNVGKAFS